MAAGVGEVLAALDAAVRVEDRGEVRLFHAAGLTVAVGPLPPERPNAALLQPRTLLVVRGEGPLAEPLKAAVRTRFLRVMG